MNSKQTMTTTMRALQKKYQIGRSARAYQIFVHLLAVFGKTPTWYQPNLRGLVTETPTELYTASLRYTMVDVWRCKKR